MNKEEKHLLRYELLIEYYKDNIFEIYRRITDNTVLDNEILNNLEGNLFITTLEKYQELQQENKQLKDNWNELKEELWNLRNITFTKEFGNEWVNCLSFNNDILPIIKKIQELEDK